MANMFLDVGRSIDGHVVFVFDGQSSVTYMRAWSSFNQDIGD